MVRTSVCVAPLMGRAMGLHFARKVQGALGPLGGADGCPSRCGIDQRHDRQRAFQEGDGNVPWIAPSNFAYRMRRYMNTRHMTELSRTIRALVTKVSMQALPEMCKWLAHPFEIAFRCPVVGGGRSGTAGAAWRMPQEVFVAGGEIYDIGSWAGRSPSSKREAADALQADRQRQT